MQLVAAEPECAASVGEVARSRAVFCQKASSSTGPRPLGELINFTQGFCYERRSIEQLDAQDVLSKVERGSDWAQRCACRRSYFTGLPLAVQSNVNRVEDWLPKTFEETKHLAWFREHFPSDQFVIVSWRGCRLDVGQATNGETNRVSPGDDPRLVRLARLLVPEKNLGEREDSLDQVNLQDPGSSTDDASPEDAAPCSKYFNSVLTGRDLLNQLTAPPLSLSVEAAAESACRDDDRSRWMQTCLIVTLRTAALSELKQVLGTGQNRILRSDVPAGILRRMIEKAGVAAEDVHLGGPPVDNNAINEEGERTLVRLAGLSGLLGLGLAWWSLRSIP
ncbi:MAG: hypothetical protein R3C56_29255 [Pirellulaceae bacterium]